MPKYEINDRRTGAVLGTYNARNEITAFSAFIGITGVDDNPSATIRRAKTYRVSSDWGATDPWLTAEEIVQLLIKSGAINIIEDR